jgi:hypothetical protein
MFSAKGFIELLALGTISRNDSNVLGTSFQPLRAEVSKRYSREEDAPMKKIVSAGLMAICALVLSQQQASAWTNSRFSIGLNWEKQSGNNSCLWGAKRDGQVPAPYVDAHVPYGPAYSHPHVSYSAAPSYSSTPYAYYQMPPSSYEAPTYANAPVHYPSPYQFASGPRSFYYYPNTWTYYGR